MRIAYITQSYPPMVSGASIVANNLAENMVARGHKVLVIAASDRGKSYKSINGNLAILRLRSYHNPLRVGQKFILSPRHAFLHALQDFQPDLIHTHDALQLGIFSLIYQRKQKIPVVLTVHALPNFVAEYIPVVFPSFRSTIETSLWMYARLILPQFDTVITPTPTTSEMIFSMTKVQPLSISNGVDLDTFNPVHLTQDHELALRAQYNLPPHVPIILYVGRLDTDKGVEQVIMAAAQAMRTTDAHLLMVGDGRQKSALLKLCKTLGIERRCHFPGYISIEEGLPDIYRLSNLFVTASEIETQGIVLLEAAASGLPIVAVKTTCIPEIVRDGLNGCLAEPKDINALAKGIANLLKNSDGAKMMGQVGRLLVNEHNISTTFNSYEQLYAGLIKQKTTLPLPERAIIHKWQERAKDWLNL